MATPTPTPTPIGTKINFDKLTEAFPDLADMFKAGNATKTNENIALILNEVLKYVFIIAGLLLLFYLIAGGFQLMTSPHEEKSVASARAKITNALIGFLLLFVSYWIVQIIQTILGFSVL
jgi:hypothetical protein